LRMEEMDAVEGARTLAGASAKVGYVSTGKEPAMIARC
jgi:hypothetical protein